MAVKLPTQLISGAVWRLSWQLKSKLPTQVTKSSRPASFHVILRHAASSYLTPTIFPKLPQIVRMQCFSVLRLILVTTQGDVLRHPASSCVILRHDPICAVTHFILISLKSSASIRLVSDVSHGFMQVYLPSLACTS